MDKLHVVIIMGTRPEAIKLAPVIKEIEKNKDIFRLSVISTAQHREMLDSVLELFDIVPDIDLNLMKINQELSGITSSVLNEITKVLEELNPDLIFVQGDTTTVFSASLAAFYLKIPVFHLEAGLRSFDRYNPFPEEINRKLTTSLTSVHLAPTALCYNNLIKEGVASESIAITGNSIVDSVNYIKNQPFSFGNSDLKDINFSDHKTILLTSHRRESWGIDLENICLAVKAIVNNYDDVQIVYPVHLNPKVRSTVYSVLGNTERIHLIDPLDYLTFIKLAERSYLILTDSGGLQEEAPSLGKPVLILRKVTERTEAVDMGISVLVGTSYNKIVEETMKLLDNEKLYLSRAKSENPFGDGKTSKRVVDVLRRWKNQEIPLLRKEDEFLTAMDEVRVYGTH